MVCREMLTRLLGRACSVNNANTIFLVLKKIVDYILVNVLSWHFNCVQMILICSLLLFKCAESYRLKLRLVNV